MDNHTFGSVIPESPLSRRCISLDGQWQMGQCEIGAGSVSAFAAMKKIPYFVPGDVHTPLIDAGLIAEPLYGANDLDCRWVEQQEFWCERVFSLEADDLRRVMRLTFEGLDCTADVYLNGNYIGRHNNAFVEVTWDVSHLLHVGENTLLVRIDQGLAEAQSHEMEHMDLMWNNEQPWRIWMRKPQFVYGWDWTVWLASCGIWKSVYLTAFDRAAISDIYARTSDDTVTEGDACHIAVSVQTEVCTGEACTIECFITDRDGREVSSVRTPIHAPDQTLALTIAQAHLWWCNGMGEPYLYRVQVSLFGADGALLDRRIQRLGLRTVKLLEPQFENGESGFTFVLNGERVFCKGANHVPCDCLPGRIHADKERTLVMQTRDAHMNMLRIWGGGVYASDEMMDACDECGIMVWHDFMYACGYYPDHDPLFLESVTDESRKAIRRLRRHASLIGWAGNNEIQEMYHCQKPYHPELRWYGGTIYESLLPSLVAQMCPELIYRASSPLGGEYQADTRHGDQHIWTLTHVDSHPNYLDLWKFTDFDVKFLSEFGLMGAMTMETAEQCIPAEHMHPDDPVWLHHTNSCQDHTLLARMVGQYFGVGACSTPQFILRSQAIQSEITRHMYEEFRRRKFTCSGLLFWTLSDSYGVHNWSLIDYALRRKPIYFSLKQAMAPLALCIKGWDVQSNDGRANWREHWHLHPGALELWGMNDTRTANRADLSWALMTLDGKVLLSGTQEVLLSANCSEHLADVDLSDVSFDPANAVFRARLSVAGQTVNETKYFFAPFSEMPARNADVHCAYRAVEAGLYELTLTSDRFVWMLHLAEPDGSQYAQNDFDLWPHEPRTVLVRSSDPNFAPELHWMGKEN